MFIPVDRSLMRTQDYDSCLHQVCEQLSASGIANFFHKNEHYEGERYIELIDLNKTIVPTINHVDHGINLNITGASI